MSRDIKFRVWDGETMYYNVGVTPDEILIYQDTKGKMVKPSVIGSIGIACDGLILEQYTPLLAKGYEGYICEGDKIYIAGVGVCTIIFDGLTFEAVSEIGEILELRGCLEDIERVIGNIHEK